MGISASKRVKAVLTNSPEFDSACDSAYEHSISLAQHAFPGVRRYQLLSAAADVHRNLSTLRFPLVLKWVPSPPSQSQVDSALRVIASRRRGRETHGDSVEEETLGPGEFKEWAVEVFTESVVGKARNAVLSGIPVGIAGIAGIGAVTRSGNGLIGAAIGVYALGVATSVFLGLSGSSSDLLPVWFLYALVCGHLIASSCCKYDITGRDKSSHCF
ncbi:PREDICTED: uncharacterized protein LOC104805901 isoform X2 [Tarenaya hassleriana]|uniref:uncharacterized protein LOC104805901 isoform X2 n=1 Tax=Tarenaya hassleriana TaxID=28532 RepID=UPI00053C25B6|nr:PREDICTED: uncharacterized protein LOC104805901 isoform X2 [Tarenaya hassleriana]